MTTAFNFKWILITAVLIIGSSQTPMDKTIIDHEKVNAMEFWVSTTLDSMSLDEKIGQLIMIRAHSNLGQDHITSVKNTIDKYHVGGLCFFQGTPTKQAALTNEYQQLSDIPLLIAIDAEWGLGMRFPKDAISFPRQLMLGAIQDNRIIYEMGLEVADQLKRIGVQVNFAPVVDVNNNPENPVINDRSFGESRYNVAAKSYAYMRGMQDGGIMACAKHFPGHGDTDVDSHLDLPIINHSKQRLDSIELMPFRVLSQHGIQSMMIAHLHVPSLDHRLHWPTSLSENTITNLLRKEIGFDGLVFSDALEMKGVRKHFEPGQVEAEALLAGNDILVLPDDVPKAIETIKIYIQEGRISIQHLNHTVDRILTAKYKLGLYQKPTIELAGIKRDIHNGNAYQIKSKLIEQSLTVAHNEKNILPVKMDSQEKYWSISIGRSTKTKFQYQLDLLGFFNHLQVSKDISEAKTNEILEKIPKGATVFVGIYNMSKYAHKDFGVNTSSLAFLAKLMEEHELVLSVFGSPYALKYFEQFPSILMAYNEDPMTEELAAQALFGGFAIRGKLPVTASDTFKYMDGLVHPGWNRLIHSIPEAVGLKQDSLLKIDSIIDVMIKEKAAPGCQILIAKEGRIVFQKSYGTHRPNSKQRVVNSDLYDVASITKIAATTISVMKLHEEGKLDVNLPISYYLPELDTTNKKDLLVKDIMAHHAGLIGWIPFYKSTLEDNKKARPDKKYYRTSKSDSFSIEVANNLYLRSDYRDTIWQKIITSPLRDTTDYRYSDLGFYLMAEAVYRITGLTIDAYANKYFYEPLGLRNTCFNASDLHPLQKIVPSEQDEYYRHQVLRGHVHDMGSAMLGGVSGHAGLFSNAEDIATIMQMLLNGGHYGGRKYLRPETVDRFTQRFPRSSRRAIGFDGKELDQERKLNMAEEASESTFGHMGFTGACTWVDPAQDIVYVFLSNRTFPSMENKKFIINNYRPKVQSVIYRAMQH